MPQKSLVSGRQTSRLGNVTTVIHPFISAPNGAETASTKKKKKKNVLGGRVRSRNEKGMC